MKKAEALILELPSLRDSDFRGMYGTVKINAAEFVTICDCMIRTQDEVVELRFNETNTTFLAPRLGIAKIIDNKARAGISQVFGVSNGVKISMANIAALKQLAEICEEIELFVPTNDPTLPVVAEGPITNAGKNIIASIAVCQAL